MIITENFFDKHIHKHHGIQTDDGYESYGFVFTVSFNIRKAQFSRMDKKTECILNSMVRRLEKVISNVPFLSIKEFNVNLLAAGSEKRHNDINTQNIVENIKNIVNEENAEQIIMTIIVTFANRSRGVEKRVIRKHVMNIIMMWRQLCNCFEIPFTDLNPLFFVWHKKGEKHETSLCLAKHLNKTPYMVDVICDGLDDKFENIDDKTYADDDLTIMERMETFADKTNKKNSPYEYIIKDYTNKSFSNDDRYLKFYLKIRPKEKDGNTLRGIVTFFKDFVENECSFADKLSLLRRFESVEGGIEFNILTLSMPSGDNEYNRVYHEDYVEIMGKKLRLFFGFEWGKYVYSNVIPMIDNER